MINLFPNRQTFVLFKIGTLTFDVRWYAVLILVGATIAYFVAKNDFKRAKYTDFDFFDSVFIYVIAVGTIGCRLWFCAFYNFDYYLANPSAIIRVWDGGLAIQGGIVFGAIFMFIYCRHNKYSFIKMLDIILPNALIGQAFGRWGNFINQECHGGEVAAEYFDGILSFLKSGMYINGHYYEPLFFYESTLCLLGFLLIHFGLKKTQNKRGDLAYAYLMWYGVIRFFIEGRRTDSLYLGPIKMAQLTSIVFLILGVLGYLGFYNKLINRNKPTLVFDFDGTIIDTSESIKQAYKECFRVYSDESKFTKEVQDEILGPALKTLFPKYFPGVDYNTIYNTYHQKQIEVSPTTNKIMPNAAEVLRKLHDNGYHMAIISTRTSAGIHELLKDFNIDDCFDDVVGLNEVKELKPNPEGIITIVNKNKWNKDCVLIGDSMMDIEAGNNYGAYTVAYLNNPDRSEVLVKAANDSITDFNQLEDILNKDISFTYNKI